MGGWAVPVKHYLLSRGGAASTVTVGGRFPPPARLAKCFVGVFSLPQAVLAFDGGEDTTKHHSTRTEEVRNQIRIARARVRALISIFFLGTNFGGLQGWQWHGSNRDPSFSMILICFLLLGKCISGDMILFTLCFLTLPFISFSLYL